MLVKFYWQANFLSTSIYPTEDQLTQFFCLFFGILFRECFPITKKFLDYMKYFEEGRVYNSLVQQFGRWIYLTISL